MFLEAEEQQPQGHLLFRFFTFTHLSSLEKMFSNYNLKNEQVHIKKKLHLGTFEIVFGFNETFLETGAPT